MATKGVWSYDPGKTSWRSGPCRIVVLAGGMFAPDTACGKVFETLRQAQAWCEAQEPEAPLPKPGEVWGVPGEPGTWRKILDAAGGKCVWFERWNDRTFVHHPAWQSWLASSGAVRIDTMPGRLAEAEGLLRRWEREPSSMPLLEQTRAFLEGEGDAR
jgi:hypothetical protein